MSTMSLADKKFPPITEIGIASMALAFSGGIYLASNIGQDVSLVPTSVLLALGAVLMVVDIALVARLRDFAWDSFWLVAKWTAVAYTVIIGMLEYIFVYNDTPGDQLVLMTLTLVVFWINVVLLLSYGVAKFQRPGDRARSRAARA
jgi:uncharacterized membrane protein YhaH (DUF805 family)